MSNYIRATKHPVTGDFENAEWLDDYYGKHRYGVRFSDSEFVYDADEYDWEFADETLGEILEQDPPARSSDTPSPQSQPSEFDGLEDLVDDSTNVVEMEEAPIRGSYSHAVSGHQHGEDCRTVMKIRNTTIDEGIPILNAYVLAAANRMAVEELGWVLEEWNKSLAKELIGSHNDDFTSKLEARIEALESDNERDGNE